MIFMVNTIVAFLKNTLQSFAISKIMLSLCSANKIIGAANSYDFIIGVYFLPVHIEYYLYLY